ncbi:MAG TPA: DOMON-like domain-containing protein [Steroidobacteraceae bacterium]|jgi:hypothetical protein
MHKTGAAPRLSLLPHPQTASDAVRRIFAWADRLAADTLRLQYVLEADLARVLVPARLPGRGGREDRLWAHTCFEAFVAVADQPGYLELNFSPSGQWAAYRFDAYRAGMAPADLLETPQIEIRRDQRQLELRARVRMPLAGGWRLALSAVVEGETGGLSYWALRHAPGRPDFHHPESFSLALEPPISPPES